MSSATHGLHTVYTPQKTKGVCARSEKRQVAQNRVFRSLSNDTFAAELLANMFLASKLFSWLINPFFDLFFRLSYKLYHNSKLQLD